MTNTTIAIAEKQRAALLSVVAAVFLTTTKIIIGLFTHSLGILSEALHSGLDLVAAAADNKGQNQSQTKKKKNDLVYFVHVWIIDVHCVISRSRFSPG